MDEHVLREQLTAQLGGGQAYTSIAEALRGFSVDRAGSKPQGVTHTAWEILEHMLIAQEDILRFSTDPDYRSPVWPDDYWPNVNVQEESDAWHRVVGTFLADLRQVRDLAEDSDRDLFAPIPHGTGQTLLREILLVADHNAYHLGQIMLLRRAVE